MLLSNIWRNIHGKYRSARAAIYGGSADGANTDNSAGTGATAGGYGYSIAGAAKGKGAGVGHLSGVAVWHHPTMWTGGDDADDGDDDAQSYAVVVPSAPASGSMQGLVIPAGASVTFTVSLSGVAPFEDRPIPYEGIRSGEIIAPRAWVVCADRLFSVVKRDVEWIPGKPMTGDVFANNTPGWGGLGCGVHAFKSTDAVVQEYRANFGSSPVEIMVVGAAALWGDVVEHERGYRASYAKVARLDRFLLPGWRMETSSNAHHYNAWLARLRERYGV